MKKSTILFLASAFLLALPILLYTSCTSTSNSSSKDSGSYGSGTSAGSTAAAPKTREDTEYQYAVHEDTRSVEILKYLGSAGSTIEVSVPASIEERPVTAIGEQAFLDFELLTTVILPDSITRIGKEAFRGCRQLEQINTPASLQDLGKGAFMYCEKLAGFFLPKSLLSFSDEYVFYDCFSLKEIEVAEGNPHYTSVDGVLYTKDLSVLLVYPAAREDTSFTIPEGVMRIADDAFSSCRNLIEITIPEGITEIGDWAFYGCSALTGIRIPRTVQSIGPSAFRECSSLEGISFPASMSVISDTLCYNCTNLRQVSIPESITTIETHAFRSCPSLEMIFIPQEVREIGQKVFEDCTDLQAIYTGADSQPDGWNYAWLGNCTAEIHWGEGRGQPDLWAEEFLAGKAAFEQGMYDTALEIFNRLLSFGEELEPSLLADIYSLRERIYYLYSKPADTQTRLGNLDLLVTILVGNPGLQEAHPVSSVYLKRARLLEASGAVDLAMEDYHSYLEYRQDDYDIQEKLTAYYFSLGDTDRLQELLDQVRERNPGRSEPYELVIDYYSALGMFEQAVEACSQALMIDDYSSYYYDRALFHTYLDQWEEALNDIDQYIEMTSADFPDYYAFRAEILHELGNIPAAINDYYEALGYAEEYVQYRPAGLYGDLGLLYLESGDPEEAVYWLEGCIERSYEDELTAEYVAGAGEANALLGDMEKAIDYYNSGVKLFPYSVKLLQGQGDSYRLLKEYDKALGAFKRMLELVEDDPDKSELKAYAEGQIRELTEELQ